MKGADFKNTLLFKHDLTNLCMKTCVKTDIKNPLQPKCILFLSIYFFSAKIVELITKENMPSESYDSGKKNSLGYDK